MARTVFAHGDVVREARRFVMLKADVTDDDKVSLDVLEMADKYQVTSAGTLALPTILFIDSKGDERSELRIVGGTGAQEFVEKMRQVS